MPSAGQNYSNGATVLCRLLSVDCQPAVGILRMFGTIEIIKSGGNFQKVNIIFCIKRTGKYGMIDVI